MSGTFYLWYLVVEMEIFLGLPEKKEPIGIFIRLFTFKWVLFGEKKLVLSERYQKFMRQ